MIWEDFVRLIKEILAKPPSKRPKDNKSFDNLVKYHASPLIPVYLHLFRDVAARLNIFLIKFQTDSPMVPFLCEEICDILKWAMRFSVQQTADTPYKLSKLDVNDREVLQLTTTLKLTTSANEILKIVPSNLHQGVRDTWLIFLQKMIEKIQERSPIKYKDINWCDQQQF